MDTSEEVSIEHYKTPTYINNLKRLVEHLHDTSAVLWQYNPQKKAPRGKQASKARLALADTEDEDDAAPLSA